MSNNFFDEAEEFSFEYDRHFEDFPDDWDDDKRSRYFDWVKDLHSFEYLVKRPDQEAAESLSDLVAELAEEVGVEKATEAVLKNSAVEVLSLSTLTSCPHVVKYRGEILLVWGSFPNAYYTSPEYEGYNVESLIEVTTAK